MGAIVHVELLFLRAPERKAAADFSYTQCPNNAGRHCQENRNERGKFYLLQCPDSSLLLTCDLSKMNLGNPGNLYTSGLRSNSQEGLEAQRMHPGTQIS